MAMSSSTNRFSIARNRPQPGEQRDTFSSRLLLAGRALSLAAPLILLAFLVSHFFWHAVSSDRTGRYPYPWQATWIRGSFHGEATTCFRKVVAVGGRIESAYVAVSADNFFVLQVNGRLVRPFFEPEEYMTWTADHSLYNSLGYPRKTRLARIYNIGPFLVPGRNVIAVKVQSDEKTPRLALQGMVTTSSAQVPLRSDDSWRCAPVEQRVEGISWTDAQFVDAGWDTAVPAGNIQIPVDGQAGALERRLRGFLQVPSGVPERGDYCFRTVAIAPRKIVGGWLRVTTDTDYDLFLNGTPVSSTAWTGRFSEQRVNAKRDFDSFQRTSALDLTLDNLPLPTRARTGVFQLRGELPMGRNLIEVVVHPRFGLYDLRPPVLLVDGSLITATGETVEIGDNNLWEAKSASAGKEGHWETCMPGPGVGSLYAAEAIFQYNGAVDPGYAGEIARYLLTSLLLAASLLSGPLIMGRAFPQIFGRRTLLLTLGRWAGWSLPPVIVLTVAYFLSIFLFPFAPEIGPWMPHYSEYALYIAGIVWLFTAGLSFLARPAIAAFGNRRRTVAERTAVHPLWRALSRYGYGTALGLILLAAAVLYCVHLGTDGHVADEYVSIYAARGIQHYGVPIYPNTHIYYTRSSLYHYSLALFMWLGGGVLNPFSTRFLAGLYQLGTIGLVYMLGRMTGGRKAGLVAAFLVAFSPYTVFYARYARFYSQFEFYTTLVFYYLLKSVRDPDRHWYRPAAILAFCGAYLSQQFAIVVIPSALAIILLSRQLHRWFEKRMIPWIVLLLAVIVLDFFAYKRFSVTPRPFVDVETVTLLSLHTDILEILPGMLFLCNEHCQVMIAGLYALGLFAFVPHGFWSRRRSLPNMDGTTALWPRWHWWSYLYLASGPTVFFTSLLAPRPASRYIENAAALVAVAAACAAVHFGQGLGRWAWQATRDRMLAQSVRWTFAATMTVALVLSFQPWRMIATLPRNITINNTDAARFIAANRQPGDAVIFRSPEVALVELGNCDYAWRPRRGSIFMYLDQNRRLRERNSGAILIDNVDKMRLAMQTHQRLWLVIPQSEVLSPGTPQTNNLVRFVLRNFRTVREPFGVQVLLWDRRSGHFSDTQNQGFDELGY